MKRIWWTVAVLAMGGVGALIASRRETGQAEATRYEPAPFARGGLAVTVESTGVVEPRNRIVVKPPIGGRIDEVLVDEGQAVRKGEVIARMSSIERATLLDAARAKGEDTLRRWEDVYKSTPLIAPLDGTVIARNTEPGQTVTAQDPVLVLSDRLVAVAQVDETDIGQVRVGQAVAIRLDAYPAVAVSGVVSRIAYEAVTVNNVTVYKVEIAPTRVPDCMKSGMTATVVFTVAEAEDVLSLPSDAITTEGGVAAVLVDADGNPATPPESWRVLTGLVAGGRTEILAGLDGGEAVVRKTFSLPPKKETGRSPFMPGRPR